MATGGGKPGLSAKVKVSGIMGDTVTFTFTDSKDVDYFGPENEYVAFFLPAPPEHFPGFGGEPKNG